MSNSDIFLTNELINYLKDHSTEIPLIFNEIEEFLVSNNLPKMSISRLQAKFIILLCQLINPKKILELGTYLGYSTLAFAYGCSADAKILTCDKNAEHLQIAKQFFQKAGMRNIQINYGEINLILENILKNNKEKMDIIFIDADKVNYSRYLSSSYSLLKNGGLVLVDNTLWRGRVLYTNCKDRVCSQMKKFNSDNLVDKRFTTIILPIGDGLTLLRKK